MDDFQKIDAGNHRFIVTNLKCVKNGRKSIIAKKFGYLCYNHKNLIQMCKKKNVKQGTKKEMSERLGIPYRDASWLIKHYTGEIYDYPHIKLSYILKFTDRKKVVTYEERVFSYIFFHYFIKKISESTTEDEELDVKSLNFNDLVGPVMIDSNSIAIKDRMNFSHKNVYSSIQKILRDFGYGEYIDQVYEKIYPLLYTFVHKMKDLAPKNIELSYSEKESYLSQVTQTIVKYGSKKNAEESFFLADKYRGFSFMPFKLPLYFCKDYSDSKCEYTKIKTKGKMEKWYYVNSQDRLELLFNPSSEGWAFNDGEINSETQDVPVIIPGLYHIRYRNKIFYLTKDSGTVLGCKDPIVKKFATGKSREDSFKQVNYYLKSSFANVYRNGLQFFKHEPVWLCYNSVKIKLFPADKIDEFLPSEIFASKERVKECVKNLLES